MAIKIITETAGAFKDNVLVDMYNVRAGAVVASSISFKHLVDYSKPFFLYVAPYKNFSQPSNLGAPQNGIASYARMQVIPQFFWEGMGITEGTVVTVCAKLPLQWEDKTPGEDSIIKINGGVVPSETYTGIKGSAVVVPRYVMLSGVKDVVITSGSNTTPDLTSFNVVEVTLTDVDGLLSAENLNEGFTTTQSGTTTAVLPVSAQTEAVQVDLTAAHKRTSPRTGTAKVAVKLGSMSASISPPLLLANQNTKTPLSVTIDKKTHPAYDFSLFEHTLTLTPQA